MRFCCSAGLLKRLKEIKVNYEIFTGQVGAWKGRKKSPEMLHRIKERNFILMILLTPFSLFWRLSRSRLTEEYFINYTCFHLSSFLLRFRFFSKAFSRPTNVHFGSFFLEISSRNRFNFNFHAANSVSSWSPSWIENRFSPLSSFSFQAASATLWWTFKLQSALPTDLIEVHFATR